MVEWQQRGGANRDVSGEAQRLNPTEAGIAARYTEARDDAEGVTARATPNEAAS